MLIIDPTKLPSVDLWIYEGNDALSSTPMDYVISFASDFVGMMVRTQTQDRIEVMTKVSTVSRW